ncbi:cell division suppressor protein YneA [Sedimentibacter sp. MB31-C6]|uniref:cell division suppressor protein YneA n=1 Tax=Sedimentibacter sp. MB31-C6 TaxID=3109366 RepID=UPI002DDD9B9D|nr:LysM peptidoglycan-binding domain-containing protein [Sedimentibacter sp. MB36-C1]WSI04233.1 LysM peptidoglycan-binding domain-containing protein [Sedimentibacter sp. MB36-C1]
MIIMNKYKVNNMKKFKRFMFITILLISILAFTFIMTLNAYSKDIPQFDYVNVKEGDTLWSIASLYTDNREIREIIYEISIVNDIHNASIYPGDIIKIPLH